MKNRIILTAVIFLLIIAAVAGVVLGIKSERNGANTETKIVDYSQYSFTDVSWTRKAENDTETLRFGSDGSYVYYCSCGNPVDDSDLNNGYTYNDETKTITLSYFETTEETVSTIKIEALSEESIRLSFDGEIREFIKNNN